MKRFVVDVPDREAEIPPSPWASAQDWRGESEHRPEARLSPLLACAPDSDVGWEAKRVSQPAPPS
jgi:hypothetical protein